MRATDVGIVFQSYALFPTMNIVENVMYGLRMSGVPKETARTRAIETLKNVGLVGYNERMPSELSGGPQQRVALARAIALDPELTMYDEPFAGLGPISLGTTAQLIRQLNDAMGLASVLVSHDLAGTFRLADHVIILGAGVVAAQGTPAEVRASTDPLVHQFVLSLTHL